MTMRRFFAPLLALPLAAVLCSTSGCSSAPPMRFHSLRFPPQAGAPLPPPVVRRVELLPIAVPTAVDQPQWVVGLPDGSLRVLEQERWVSPLRDELRAAVMDELRARHGVADARSSPNGEPAWRVRLEATRFGLAATTGAHLEAHWTVTPPEAVPAFSCAVSEFAPAAGDPLALAGAQRRNTATLADRIAGSLTLGACPPHSEPRTP